MSEPRIDREWWKEAVVYQIYPRSFNDSDGDGIGDIPGIVEKLDYLDYLGVDVVWLNPVYESPEADNGYDVSDYRAVMDKFGTMADWEELLAGLHDRDMKLIMDLVVNHTSDEHEWFVNAREDPDSEYRDYYVWREGEAVEAAGTGGAVGQRPPNDWESFFGGPAWTYDEGSGEWYLHLFHEKQPDLNWDNPEVRTEIFEMMEFWLEKGIDGFRMDVINVLSKPEGLPEGEDDDAIVRGAEQFVNGPRIHEFLGEMYDRVLSNYDVMTVGEMVDLSVDEAKRFIGPHGDGMSMAFNFDHMRLDFGHHGRWDQGDWSVKELKRTLSHWQHGLEEEGWNSVYMGNHDEPRMVSRFGHDGQFRRESAKLLATVLMTLQGTTYVYQGDEIGMTNYPFSSLDEVRDVDTIRNVEVARQQGRFADEEEMLELVRHRSRDNARTPMQWTADDEAGFTDGTPWIPVNPNHTRINVDAERGDPESVLEYYRRVIDLRHEHDVLVYGRYTLHLPDHDCLWVFERELESSGEEGNDERKAGGDLDVDTGGADVDADPAGSADLDGEDGGTDVGGDDGQGGDAERVLVVLNFSDTPTRFRPPASISGLAVDLLVSNYDDVDAGEIREEDLRPYEARVLEVRQ
ncbi:alpha-glucosidase [Halobium palmae]|uniref:Alpha-glucosidase n=1 Tax=Halobium palmae TaxID=1776492 RepID=A0ABD5RXX7_9EURY